MKQICGRASKKLSKSTQKSNISQQLKGAVVLLVMLGLTWTIAFLAVSEATLPFQIAFTCLNGFQGFFIFLFHCVFKSDVRNLWKKKVFSPESEATKTSKGKFVTVDLYNGNMKLCFYYFYTPVFRQDVLWYGDVRPSVRVSVRQSQFSTLFSYMFWLIELYFLCYFLLMNIRSSSSIANFRHICSSYAPFGS